jgi:uncharacterized membrane protein
VPIQTPLNEYSFAYPILVCIHLSGMACGVGTVALVNLRLLGVGLTQKSAAQLWRDAMPWTLGGLALAIFSGLLLFSIDPEMYYNNHVFRSKMLVLVLAIVFYYTMVRKTAASDTGTGSLVAWISLGLWALVPFGGTFIGFAGSVASSVLLALHIVALIVLGGMIVVTDLRLLGIGLGNYSTAEIAKGLRVPKRVAFLLAAVCGVLMFAARAEEYSHNPWFWIKIGLLVLIGGIHLMFRRNAKLTAALSLFLWAGAVWAARGPATVKDIMHSMVEPSGDFLFQSVRTIADEDGVREKAPHTEAEWDGVRQRLLILSELPDLLSAPNLRAARARDRSKNPEVESEPGEVQRLLDTERPDFIRRAYRLRDAASIAMNAVEKKNKDALRVALDGIDKACESCHLHYWYPNDKRAREAAKENGVIE